MTYRITKEHVWVGAIPDRADALAEKLRALRDGGLNLELILARRTGAGHGLLFVAPLRTLEEITAVETAGLVRSATMKTIRIEGPNVAGLGAKIETTLADAGLNIHENAAAAQRDRSVTNNSFYNDAEGDRARELLLKVLA